MDLMSGENREVMGSDAGRLAAMMETAEDEETKDNNMKKWVAKKVAGYHIDVDEEEEMENDEEVLIRGFEQEANEIGKEVPRKAKGAHLSPCLISLQLSYLSSCHPLFPHISTRVFAD